MKPDTCALVAACGTAAAAGEAVAEPTDPQTAGLAAYKEKITAANALVGVCTNVAVAENESVTHQEVAFYDNVNGNLVK